MQLIKDYRVLMGLQPGAAAHLAIATLIEQYANVTQASYDWETKHERKSFARTDAVKHIIKGINYHLDDDNFSFQRPIEIGIFQGLDDMSEFYGRCITQNLASTKDILRALVDINNPYRKQSYRERLFATPQAINSIDGAWNELKDCYDIKEQYTKPEVEQK